MRPDKKFSPPADSISAAVLPLDPRDRRRLETFAPANRSAIAVLIARSPRLADLADSFPALLFALATGYATAAARTAAIEAVEAGSPLKEAARLLCLPMWLRKMPAASLTPGSLSPGSPADGLVRVPSDSALSARLVSLIPPQPKAAAAWLDRVIAAHQTGRAELTLWVAQQYKGHRPAAHGALFLTTLAWAWFSLDGQGSRGASLITEKWRPSLGAARAAKAAALWRERIALEVCLGPGIADAWMAEGAAGSFDFIALRTADDFIAEAGAMDNCLDRYADRLVGRAVRVFSIRQDGRSIADMEIATHEREPGHPVIAQLRGPHNRRASLDVWRAAYQWLGSQPLRLADKSTTIRVSPVARRRRQDEIWRPFLANLPPSLIAAVESGILSRKPKRTAAISPLSASPPAAAPQMLPQM